jgi:hypothetical protein
MFISVLEQPMVKLLTGGSAIVLTVSTCLKTAFSMVEWRRSVKDANRGGESNRGWNRSTLVLLTKGEKKCHSSLGARR